MIWGDAVKKITIQKTIHAGEERTAADFLSGETGLSRSRVKDAMNKGAVSVRREGKMHRLRKATATLRKGMYIEMHYDEKVLSIVPPQAECLLDMREYSGWLKPAGLMSQGTHFGDHCSLLRQVDRFFVPKREVFLIHRLDREVAGVMIIAHTKKMATAFSKLFGGNMVEKIYRAEVLGDVSWGYDRPPPGG